MAGATHFDEYELNGRQNDFYQIDWEPYVEMTHYHNQVSNAVNCLNFSKTIRLRKCIAPLIAQAAR